MVSVQRNVFLTRKNAKITWKIRRKLPIRGRQPFAERFSPMVVSVNGCLYLDYL
ncbi:MAG: hypothetical protein LBU34_16520 [Planctomycetaceae bacterium]|nr:hypothetical protein [Planctomycetaceae bacterium]